MNVLILQSNGVHNANRKYRECFSLQRAFNSISEVKKCDVWGLNHFNFKLTPKDYDLVIGVEQRNFMQWYPWSFLKETKAIKVQWAIDTHSLTTAPFDYICKEGKFQLQLQSCVEFCKDKNNPWFPNCYDNDLIKPLPDIEKKHNYGFCGSGGGEREALIDILVKKYNLKKDIFIIGDDMVKVINSYKVHFNKNVLFDINYRTFETLGCGTALITNYHPRLIDLGFNHSENIFIYKNINELYDCMDEIIKNNLYIDIAKKGHELVSKKHTYKNRVKMLLNYIKTVI